MKHNIIVLISVVIAFVIGALFGSCNTCKTCNSTEFKCQLIESQAIALDKAARLIDKHNLFDADGSQLMDEYMAAYNRVDSLYNTQR